MTTLTRKQAKAALTAGGWPDYLLDIMVAVGAAESSLKVEAQSPPNPNGTVDYGWLQINSVHKYDQARLVTDPAYTAQCAYAIYRKQGLTAWYGYKAPDGSFPHRRFLPPHLGGVPMTVGDGRWFLVVELQERLNAGGEQLVVDGVFGARTSAAVKRFQQANPLPVDGTVWNVDSLRLIF